jgi:hypothetical protein
MQKQSISIRRMNPYATPSEEPLYRPTFFHGEGAGRGLQQGEPITGREALKRVLEQPLHQSTETAESLVQRLDEERSVEIFGLTLLDEDVVMLGLK